MSPGQISPGAGAEIDKEETVSVYPSWTTSPRPGSLFGNMGSAMQCAKVSLLALSF